MTAPRPGDRVRVVIEGEVQTVSGWKATVGTREAAYTYIPIAESVPGVSVSVEVLPSPEPDWQRGDVAWYDWESLDGGETLLRGDGVWVDVGGTRYPDRSRGGFTAVQATRLTLLVRDGKPVLP